MNSLHARTIRTLGFRFLGAGFILMAGVRCAHVEAPSGGPVDTVPPAVAAVYPAPGATGVSADARAIFQFTEWIDRNAARGTVFLSPPYAGRLRVEVDGDRLIVLPPAGQTLRPRTTHTVTVLGTLKDLRGNAMGPVFDLRFSTGATLDSAGLDGALRRDDRRGSLVAALYATGAARTADAVRALSLRDTGFAVAATPEPWRELPAALAGSDSSGAFRLAGAAAGDYALFAFEDLNGNFAFDLGLEAAAVGEASLALRPRAAFQALRLAPLDTMPLRFAEVAFARDSLEDERANETVRTARARGLVPGALVVAFARAPHPARAAEAARYIALPDSGAPVAVTGASWNLARAAWVLEVPPLRPGRWRLAVRARPDFPERFGADLPDTSAPFEVGPFPETPAPEPSMNGTTQDTVAADSAADAEDDPAPVAVAANPDPDWTLTPLLAGNGPDGLPQTAPFLGPGARAVFASSLALSPERWSRLTTRAEARMDTRANTRETGSRAARRAAPRGDSAAGKDAAEDSLSAVPFRLERLSAWSFAAQLSAPLRAGRTFEFRLAPPAGDSAPARVLFTGRVPDSATAAPVKFLPPANGSKERGLASLTSLTYWAAPARVATGAQPTFFPLRRGTGDTLVSSPVPPGRYLVHALHDRDGDGVWNPGSLRPWVAQEPYEVMADTVVVGGDN